MSEISNVLDELNDTIIQACRELREWRERDDNPRLRRSELERRESALRAIDEILEWRPLASFKAEQLEFLELLFAYWRECEVEAEAPEPDALH